MLAETLVTQHSPCYSAVSYSLMNPLPDRSNYLPFCHTHYPILRINQYFTGLFESDPLQLRSRLILYCCSALLQNLDGNSGEMQCLEEAEQQAEASVDVPPPPLQIVISVPFCLFSLYPLSAPFLNPLSSPFPHFP